MSASHRPPSALTEKEHAQALEILSFGAGAEGIKTLIDVLVLPVQGNSDARAKAARRTRIYKVRQVLRKSPGSEHVMAACGYITLQALAQAGPDEPVRGYLLDVLREAGFDAEQAGAAIARLTDGAVDRKEAWKRRVRQQQATRLAAAVKDAEAEKAAGAP